MKVFKALALVLALASAASAQYYGGGTIKPHGHSTNADGGRITNLTLLGGATIQNGLYVTAGSTQITNVAAFRELGESNSMLTLSTSGIVTAENLLVVPDGDEKNIFAVSTFTAKNQTYALSLSSTTGIFTISNSTMEFTGTALLDILWTKTATNNCTPSNECTTFCPAGYKAISCNCRVNPFNGGNSVSYCEATGNACVMGGSLGSTNLSVSANCARVK